MVATVKEIPPPSPVARAHARALARTLLMVYERNEDPDIIEDLRRSLLRIWRLKYKYYKDDDLFQELVRRGLLPPRP